eukprot:163341_1
MASISLERTPISKERLENARRHQLMNGETNHVHQDAIIRALGGIDEILQHLFASNVVLEQQQLDSLHHIIADTSHTNQQITAANAAPHQPEDQTHTVMALTYTFKDEDSLLFAIFGQENGTKILHVLNDKILKCILLLLLGVFIILGVLILYGLSWDVYLAYWTVVGLFASIYTILWILYTNKEAMKLLLKQFEFWFKIVYLIQYS